MLSYSVVTPSTAGQLLYETAQILYLGSWYAIRHQVGKPAQGTRKSSAVLTVGCRLPNNYCTHVSALSINSCACQLTLIQVGQLFVSLRS